jgi:hypothetical protein
MSALTQHPDHAARRRAAERARLAGRSRRSDAGSVTEMAIALLRDAREGGRRQSAPRRGAGGGAGPVATATSRAARRLERGA